MNHDEAVGALSYAAGWHKSSCSQGQTGCVEVSRQVPGWIGVRDSKLGGRSPILAFTPHEWTAFLAGARDGEFDRPTPNP